MGKKENGGCVNITLPIWAQQDPSLGLRGAKKKPCSYWKVIIKRKKYSVARSRFPLYGHTGRARPHCEDKCHFQHTHRPAVRVCRVYSYHCLHTHTHTRLSLSLSGTISFMLGLSFWNVIQWGELVIISQRLQLSQLFYVNRRVGKERETKGRNRESVLFFKLIKVLLEGSVLARFWKRELEICFNNIFNLEVLHWICSE